MMAGIDISMRDSALVPHDGETIEASIPAPAVFGVVFDRHFESIHRYVARRFGAHIADDVAAEVFAQAFASRDRFEIHRPDARPWLFGITANLLRRRARQDAAQWKAFAKYGHDPFDVDVAAAPRLDEAAVAKALAAISSREREALLLMVWAELTYDEIALALDIPIGTVRSRINRARTKLRITLEDLR